jgi:dipeptidase E
VTNELDSVQSPEIIMARSSSEIADKNLSDYSAIFIGGGNTYKLLKELNDTAAFDKIKDFIKNNGVVYGCSAGSIIFGKNINSISYMDPNDIELNETQGADILFGMSITAHYTNKNEEKTALATNHLIEYSKDKEAVIALPEEDTLFINDDIVKIVGTKPYYIFHNGIKTEYQPNIEYSIDKFSKLSV